MLPILSKKRKLAWGITEGSAYGSKVYRAFTSGLTKSRAKLLNDKDIMVNNKGHDVLEVLETPLLQSDLDLAMSKDIMKYLVLLDGEQFCQNRIWWSFFMGYCLMHFVLMKLTQRQTSLLLILQSLRELGLCFCLWEVCRMGRTQYVLLHEETNIILI